MNRDDSIAIVAVVALSTDDLQISAAVMLLLYLIMIMVRLTDRRRDDKQ
jgi:hypothetical protein